MEPKLLYKIKKDPPKLRKSKRIRKKPAPYVPEVYNPKASKPDISVAFEVNFSCGLQVQNTRKTFKANSFQNASQIFQMLFEKLNLNPNCKYVVAYYDFLDRSNPHLEWKRFKSWEVLKPGTRYKVRILKRPQVNKVRSNREFFDSLYKVFHRQWEYWTNYIRECVNKS